MEVPQRIRYALGKNIGEGWKPKDIRSQRFNLSNHSRVTVIATGLLNRQSPADYIVFSTGHTAGNDKPSEAEAMNAHYHRIFKKTSQGTTQVILEDRSKDTWGNAQEAQKINRDLQPEAVELITVGFHTQRAQELFRGEGLNPNPVWSSEEVLRDKFPRFYAKYVTSELYQAELNKEKKARLIQSLPLGKQVLRLIVLLQRRG